MLIWYKTFSILPHKQIHHAGPNECQRLAPRGEVSMVWVRFFTPILPKKLSWLFTFESSHCFAAFAQFTFILIFANNQVTAPHHSEFRSSRLSFGGISQCRGDLTSDATWVTMEYPNPSVRMLWMYMYRFLLFTYSIHRYKISCVSPCIFWNPWELIDIVFLNILLKPHDLTCLFKASYEICIGLVEFSTTLGYKFYRKHQWLPFVLRALK